MKLGEAKPQSRNEHQRLEDLVDVVKLPNNKWVQIRILNTEIISYKQHWINILASKTKREVRIPKLCLAHDPQTEESSGECPYCEVESQSGTNYLLNVIVRSLQEDAPAKIRSTKAESASGFKDLNSESWTPVRVLRLTSGLMKKVQELKGLNKVKGKDGVKTFDVNHEKYGVDLNIKYDENAKGPEKYQVNMAEKSPLTEEELSYLTYEVSSDTLDAMGLETLAEAKKELSRMQIVGAEEFDEDADLGKKKSKTSKNSKSFDDEDDEDLPVKSAKKPAAKSKKVVDEDDDDFDDDDEDDEAPPKRGAKPAAKSKKVVDEDDDDFDDEDDEDEAPPKRVTKPAAKKPVAKSKKVVDEDDEDDSDFDDEDDEDEDEAPPKRGAKPAAKKPAVKSKKVVDDDEDDSDFDDEDDEDEPPKRSAKKPVAAKATSKTKPKKKPVDEDEDEDEPF